MGRYLGAASLGHRCLGDDGGDASSDDTSDTGSSGNNFKIPQVNPAKWTKGGKLDWNTMTEQTSAAGGAAICTYYGAGVAAPLCAELGLYSAKIVNWINDNIIKGFKDLFGIKNKQDWEGRIASLDETIATTLQWYELPDNNSTDDARSYIARLHRAFAFRTMALLTARAVDGMATLWSQNVAPCTWPEAYARMRALGFKPMPGWQLFLGLDWQNVMKGVWTARVKQSDAFIGTVTNSAGVPYAFETQTIDGTRKVFWSEWMMATIMFGDKIVLTQYDDPAWWKKNAAGLDGGVAKQGPKGWDFAYFQIASQTVNGNAIPSVVFQVDDPRTHTGPSPILQLQGSAAFTEVYLLFDGYEQTLTTDAQWNAVRDDWLNTLPVATDRMTAAMPAAKSAALRGKVAAVATPIATAGGLAVAATLAYRLLEGWALIPASWKDPEAWFRGPGKQRGGGAAKGRPKARSGERKEARRR